MRAELTLGVAVGFLGVFSRSVAAAAPPEHSHKVEEDRGSMAFRERIEREKSGIETNGWWGQPMDPKVFWRDKVVWLDAVAIDAARQRGRRMPPPAFDDSAMSLESYSSLIIDGAEGARERLYAHECRFWEMDSTSPSTTWRHRSSSRKGRSRLFLAALISVCGTGEGRFFARQP